MSIWTKEEFKTFITHVNKSAIKLAFDILFYTGMRSGELLVLTPEDILPEKEIKRKAEAAGLPVIRGHDLLHSHASLLIEMGFDILEVSERLGQESVETTWDTYSHLYPDKDQNLAGQLNRLQRRR